MLSFGAPLFLAGLAFLAAPILIHLINRYRATPLRFPSIRFIQPSVLPQQGRRSPRDLLLLLIRLLLITAVVLALAQPHWNESNPSVTADGENPPALVFLVDASASMQAEGAWARAESIIRQTLREAPSGTPAGMVVIADEILHQTPLSRGDQVSLDGLSPTLAVGNPPLGVSGALNLLADTEPARLVVISDFQAGEWSRMDWPRLPPEVDLKLEPVHETLPANAAILNAQVFNAPGNRLRVIARIANLSPDPLKATLALDQQYEQTVEIPAWETRPAVITLPRAEPRPALLTLSAPAADTNAYTPDDTWHLWLGAPPPLRTGLLVPVDQEPEKGMEAAFVAQALQTDAQTGHRDFQLLPVDGDLRDANGHRPDILYLAGAGAYLEDSQLAQVREFVENGGILLVTPSQAASRQQHRLREAGITAHAYLGQPGRHGRSNHVFHIGGIDPQSALGRLFDDEAARDLYLASLFQYARLEPGPGSTVLLATEDGDPILLEESLGRGTVLTFAVGLDTSWSDLPLRNAFLPLLRELLVEASAGNDPVRHIHATSTRLPGASLVDGIPVEVNVARSESSFNPVPLSSLRSSLQGGAATRAVRASDAQAPDTGQPLWPWLAFAALILILLENLLAGVTSGSPSARPRPASA